MNKIVEVLGATLRDTELWMFDRRASTLQRLTFGGGQDPLWTADGARVVYSRLDSLGEFDLADGRRQRFGGAFAGATR